MYRPTTAALAAALAIATLSPAQAAIIYSTIGSTYSQNFNSLPTTPQNTSLGNTPAGWTNDNATPAAGNFSILGWHLFHPTALGAGEGGANGNQRFRIGTGSNNSGAFWSFGESGMADRALGGINSGTLSSTNANMFLGAKFTNNTGAIMTSFTLSYDGEQWRDGGAATPNVQRLDFDYSLNATTIQDATFTNEDALDFVSPVFANTGGGNAVAGNSTGMLPIGPVTVTGINWAPGTDLWIRWRDVNNSGNDHGLSIDNLQFSAIPEPGSVVLFVAAVLALVGYRRFR